MQLLCVLSYESNHQIFQYFQEFYLQKVHFVTL